jgi:hypothetical protein
MKLGLPHGTKMKDAPPELRMLWRLITLTAQRVNKANLKVLAEAEAIGLAQGMAAVNLLVNDKHVTVSAFNGSTFDFEFTVDNELAGNNVARDAASYRRYLEARKDKAIVPRSPGKHLPVIPEEEREPWMAKAKPLATKLLKLEHEHTTWELAGCIARIGLEAVTELVNETCKQPHDRKDGARKDFFVAYRVKRDEHLQPEQEAK